MGIVLDLNSEVCPRSFLDNTKIGEATDVYVSNLIDSWADNSKIVHSEIHEGDIVHSELVHASVVYSDVVDSKVYDGVVIGSKIDGVTLRGGVIRDCTISADVVVGQAELIGLTIDQDMRIGTGRWTTVPRRFEIQDPVSKGVVVTESTDGCAYIGCQRKPMRTWMKGSRRFGKAIGWSTDTTDHIVSVFEEWLRDN